VINIKTLTRIMACVLLLAFASLAFSGCTNKDDGSAEIERLEREVERIELEKTGLEENASRLGTTIIQLESDVERLSAQTRVFYNGNSDIWLFPDGTFILNYFHNTKYSGTYEEKTEGNETAVLFTYNGAALIASGESSYEPSGNSPVTVVGGIVDNILTIPEDFEDDHGHGNKYKQRETLVFEGGNGNKITLNTDRSFIAEFNNGIKIMGYYAIRAFAQDHNPAEGTPMPYGFNSVTFIPGMPTFNASGELGGAVFAVPIVNGTTLTIPEVWVGIAGAETFILQ